MGNLRKVDHYDIGLDIGTGSVGWAVLDSAGELLHFKGRPTWGSRTLPSAETAASARAPRSQRRRYERRRWRLDLLQSFFADEMSRVDPTFFVRLNQSRLHPEDKSSEIGGMRHPIFNGSDFEEAEYYRRFPTIYHLRTWLMETDEKADLRLVYLALHNIVKYRGNFLHQDNKGLSAKNADMEESVDRFCDALESWCVQQDIACLCDRRELRATLENAQSSRAEKRDAVKSLLGLDKSYEKTMGKELAGAMVGYQAEFARVFFCEGEATKFKLSEDEKVEAFFAAECPEEGRELFEAMQAVYSSFVLMGVLKGSDGKTISACKVKSYDRYGQDLKTLKALVREYAPGSYKEFFGGAMYADGSGYDPAQAKGYTKYDLKHGGTSYQDFQKEVEKLLRDSGAEVDERYIAMIGGFQEESFLRRQKTSDNGSIPFQLHLEEMTAILENQGAHYPFLKEQAEKICSLVTFRIPYYVGPLTTKNAAKDRSGKMRFAWSERCEGMEDERIYPWNWDRIIDRQKSAQNFIERMTGTCTYLQGEPVLPKSSLLYEEFCVLNELNGAWWTQDGDDKRRFDYGDRSAIVEELFRNGSVSYEKLSRWMRENRGHAHVHVGGGQGETKFESRLSSYLFFRKDVFGVDEIPQSDYPMIEEIILWSTLFEDRGILKEKIEAKYGNRLDGDQIKRICKKRFSGWGRLSRKFLTGIKAHTDDGDRTIMDVLREGDPNNGGHARAMVLMEVLRDDKLRFQELVDQINQERFASREGFALEDIPGSPALRRSINQAVRIVEEIVRIAGHEPDHIYIEVTRDEDQFKKGHRTKRRYDALSAALKAFKTDCSEFWDEAVLDEFKSISHADLDERLTLYFMQNGRSLYSWQPLDIGRLSEYQVDHILPQSYIKDDSLDNKALVLREENQRKTDQLLIDSATRSQMKAKWSALFEAGLISEKKYKNLMRDKVTDRQLKGFIARQLVETSQIVKFVQMMLKARLKQADIVPVKAALSSQLRDRAGFVKCREINDYHHAHDAMLACSVGRFIHLRHPGIYENPIGYSHVVRKFIRMQGEEAKARGRMPGSASYLIESFMRSGFSKETGEIFQDTWDAEFEIGRIRRFLDYKDCFISRMPEETSGAFWDATIYSPRNAKGSGLRLKEGLDCGKYGMYSSEKFAYFYVYEGRDRKGRSVYDLDSVPVRVASLINEDSRALENHARNVAESQGLDFVRIVREKVLKYQLIEVDGERLYLTGIKEVRNGVQIAFSQRETEIIKRMVEGEPVEDQEAILLFESVCERYGAIAGRLGRQIGVENLASAASSFAACNLIEALGKMIAIASAKVNMIDITCIGGVKCAGCMRLTYKKLLSSDNNKVFFIDQSVTGMFERRTKVGL